MRAAQIDNGVVVNIIKVDSLDALPNLVDAAVANIGDLWDGEKFVPYVDPEVKRTSILAEIERLEGAPNYLNRGARELQLRLMEKEAEEWATERGLTKEQVLNATSYYLKLKALDDEIKALRVQL